MNITSDSFYSLGVLAWTKIQSKHFPSKNQQRAITPKNKGINVFFLVHCTSPFYQCMKFQFDGFSSLNDVALTKIQNEIIKGKFIQNYW